MAIIYSVKIQNTGFSVKSRKIDKISCHCISGRKLSRCKYFACLLMMIFIGDFNAKNTAWWGDTDDYPGESISNITGLHGLHEIINQPTHFYPGKNPSCIDLIFCSQPNLISESPSSSPSVIMI